MGQNNGDVVQINGRRVRKRLIDILKGHPMEGQRQRDMETLERDMGAIRIENGTQTVEGREYHVANGVIESVEGI